VASLPKDVHIQRPTPSDFESLSDLELLQLIEKEARALLEERFDASEEN
jgi:hypothetical protein